MKLVQLTSALLQKYLQGGYVFTDDAAGIERRGLIEHIVIGEDGKLRITFSWLFESKGNGKWIPIARESYSIYLGAYNSYEDKQYIYLLSPSIRSLGVTLVLPKQWTRDRSYFEKMLRRLKKEP